MPGTLPAADGSHSLYCAVIVKQVDEQTLAKTASTRYCAISEQRQENLKCPEYWNLPNELVARPSVTPDDAGCQRLITERLLPLGFDVEWFLCGDVSNVLITRGSGSPSLWFLGHTDVVPTGPEEMWTFLPFHPDDKRR